MWKKIEVLGNLIPKGRSSSAIASVGTNLYLFGGEYVPRVPVDDLLYCFDTLTSKWSVIANSNGTSPIKRLAHTMTAIGKHLYVYGGRRENEEDDLDDLHQFNTETNEWRQLTTTTGNGPQNRSYHSATNIDKMLFIFGGCQHSTQKHGDLMFGTKRMNDLHALNVDTLEWKKIDAQNPPSIRGGPTLCSGHNNQLFVHGGFNGKELGELFVCDLQSLIWKQLIPTDSVIPGPRSVHSLLPLKSGSMLITICGEKEPSKKGHLGSGEYWNDTFVYDVDANKWTKCIYDTGPSARGWIQATNVNDNTIILFGGFTGDDRINDIWQFQLQQ